VIERAHVIGLDPAALHAHHHFAHFLPVGIGGVRSMPTHLRLDFLRRINPCAAMAERIVFPFLRYASPLVMSISRVTVVLMSEILVAIFTGLATFSITNVDDIFVLTMFFSGATGRLPGTHVVLGHFCGFTLLLFVSLVAFFSLRIAPLEWIGLLGFVPMVLAIRRWFRRNQPPRREQSVLAGAGSVAAITFANGSDNIAVYTPLFARSDATWALITVATFYVLAAVWCLAGFAISRHPKAGVLLVRRERTIMPLLLFALGVYIIISTGTYKLFTRWL
jgi:cadmium resistance protein CadD (predicted permease)